MQSTTAEVIVSEAALLSPEELQSLSKAARILGKGIEEVTRDVTNYLRQHRDLSPMALKATAREAVRQWMDWAAGAEAVAAYGSSTTGQLDHKMALLAKRQAALNTALQQGRENPVDRASESSRQL
jgi:hypothetical protein